MGRGSSSPTRTDACTTLARRSKSAKRTFGFRYILRQYVLDPPVSPLQCDPSYIKMLGSHSGRLPGSGQAPSVHVLGRDDVLG